MSSKIRRLPAGGLVVIAIMLMLLVAACGGEAATETATPAASPEATQTIVTGQDTPTATPTITPSPATATPTSEPQTATATPTPSPTPTASSNPYSMESLFSREYTAGEIARQSVLEQNEAYTSYLITYPSDGLTIRGVMRIPTGDGPFPVIVMNHGHYEPGPYISGQGTDAMADIVARAGYITLASDYRGHGQSEGEPAQYGSRTEYAVDVLNLIACIPSISEADGSRIGMWGHSMGGEVSMVVSEVSKDIKASVVWAPTSGDATANANFYSRRGGAGPAPLDGPSSAAVSPLYFVDRVTGPIQMHQGDIDVDVDPQWAIRWRDALQAVGKDIEFYWYEGQGHNFREQGWGVIAPRTVEFYDRYLK